MKKLACIITLLGVLFITGCTRMEPITNSNFQNDFSEAAVFMSGMGCSDPDCTDLSHHHDCPSDCENYDHHHNCGLDCSEASHHHNNVSGANDSGQHHQTRHHGGYHH